MPQAIIDMPELVARVGARGSGRTEADVQSDVRTILLYGGLNLDDQQVVKLEEQTADGTRRRIDIAVGFTVIEIKEDLRSGNVKAKAIEQLAGYVQVKTQQLGQRYTGVLTDGCEWLLYYLQPDGTLGEVSAFWVRQAEPDVEGLVVWLEAVLATATSIAPIPTEIVRRLGAESPAFALDYADLSAIYDSCWTNPEIRLKRELWAKLLTTALGTNFTDSDQLFIEHTYLVVSAEIIAHSVVGFDPSDPGLTPATLVTGQAFTSVLIHGVVEPDFFDWVIEGPGGPEFVRGLARRLRRFTWTNVEHDVLKVLYESVIGAVERKQLGEYYTPDWLADRMVAEVVTDPLKQRVLDPACGSGTFVFHAVRRYLDAADQSGMSNSAALQGVTTKVFGLDLHPVAVTLARVTYLLAIGTQRLSATDRGPLNVPVYLGDSVQWDKRTDMLTSDGITIPTTDGAQLFASELIFPERLLSDAGRFDELVADLVQRATSRPRHSPHPSIRALLSNFAVHQDDRAVLLETFRVLCELHDQEWNHVWGYYVRNLVRPLWLTRLENKVDVLIGNPPWLAYGFMTLGMKSDFREQSKARNIWPVTRQARNPDLSAYFVVKSIELYLKPSGSFGFVMPNAVLSRQQFAGLRGGDFRGPIADLTVTFTNPWDLADVQPDMFPMPSCAIFGQLTPGRSVALPLEKVAWSGRLPRSAVGWTVAEPLLARTEGTSVVATTGHASPYAQRFSAGANIRPRVLLCVEETSAGPLGPGAGRIKVRSRRTPQEKDPWKGLSGLEDFVERQFVRPVHLGSTVTPFRLLEPWLTVIPWDGSNLLSGDDQQIDRYPALAKWWRKAEAVWTKHNKQGEKIKLADQVNYRRSLTHQFPTAPQRVVYTKSGTTLAACRVADPAAVIDHTLYWASAADADEAHYLCAIINSDILRERVKPLQSRGLFGARHWDKYIFSVPSPIFDPSNPLHQEIAKVGASAETLAGSVVVPSGIDFKRARGLIRVALAEAGIAAEIESLIDKLLPTLE